MRAKACRRSGNDRSDLRLRTKLQGSAHGCDDRAAAAAISRQESVQSDAIGLGGPRGRPEGGALKRRRSLWREIFGFPQAYAAGPRSSATMRFSRVGLIWISLDSLVRNELFQWVTGDPGPFLFFGGPFSGASVGKRRPGSLRRSRAEPARRMQDIEEAGIIMAVDIVNARSRIGIRLTPLSLFGKKLSIGRHLCKSPAVAYFESRS